MSTRKRKPAKKADVTPSLTIGGSREGTPAELRWVLTAAAVIFFFVFFACAGSSWPAALYRLFTDGTLAALWLTAMFGAGAQLLKLFRLESNAARFPTAAALGIGLYSLLLLALGLAGVLNRFTAWALLLAGDAAAFLPPLLRKGLRAVSLVEKLKQPVPATAWLWLLIVPFAAVATVATFIPPGLLWGAAEPNGYDVVEYHLQVPREWFELGRILPLHHNVFSYFPFNVELHYLFAMHLRNGPWAGMYLAQLMHLTTTALAVAAVYGFVGRKGLIGALLVAATPWLTMLGSIAYNEGGVLLFGTLAIGWVLRSLAPGTPGERAGVRGESLRNASASKNAEPLTPDPSPLSTGARGTGNALGLMSLAGVMAGLACGTKLTSVPMLLVFLPIAYLIATFVRRELKRAIVPIALFLAFALLTFAPWLLRNFLWTRNPVFPEAMSLLGHAHFSPEQVTRWQLAYVPDPQHRDLAGRLRALGEQVFADWRFGYALFPAAALAAFGAIRKRLDPAIVFCLTLFAAWAVFWLAFTHLQGRFFVLAVPLAAFLVARVEQPVAKLTMTCLLLAQVGFGLLGLSTPVAKLLIPLAQVIGVDDYRWASEDIDRAAQATGDVCLIGDAKAFLYPVPSRLLHYRTVFDVDAAHRDVISAWSQGCPQSPGDLVFINYGELERFHRTYYAIPAVDAPPSTRPAPPTKVSR